MNWFFNRPSTIVLFSALLFVGSQAAAQDSRRQKPEDPQSRNQYRDQADTMLQDNQQKDTQSSFAGQISQKHGKFYLEPEFHKSPFELANPWEAKRFVGKKVRITGVLVDPEKNILRVIAITAIPGSQPRTTNQAAQPACPTPPCR